MAKDLPTLFQAATDRQACCDELRACLAGKGSVRSEGEDAMEILYLDSFDWRIARAGRLLEARRGGLGYRLVWASRDDSSRRLVVPAEHLPRAPDDLEPGPLRRQLADLLGERVLMHAAHVRSAQETLLVQNRNGKTVLRVEVSEHTAHDGTGQREQALGTWIRLVPMRGYEKAARRAARRILELDGCKVQQEDLLTAAARSCGIRPLDYSSKPDLPLDTRQSAGEAFRKILHTLQEGFRQNEQGMCDAIDIEFLHDFRVYVRRTRAAVTDIRGVVDAAALAPWQAELRWLQQVTGASRDLDVYLLSIPAYRNELPEEYRQGLVAFETYLQAERQRAHLALTNAIRSTRYRRFCHDFAGFIEGLPRGDQAGPDFHQPIGTLSAKLLRRTCTRVLDDGRAITADSPAEALHDLRKRCKRLRYLLEFFTPLYPARDIGSFLKTLKGLQENLGNFQDYEVQAETLARMSREMTAQEAAPAETYLALGVLIERLNDRSRLARSEFHQRFSAFDTPAMQKRFRRMCKQQA